MPRPKVKPQFRENKFRPCIKARRINHATMHKPNLYEDGFLEQAYKYCLLGATNRDLADLFSVHIDTIDRWIEGRAGFADALRAGRDIADANVAKSLYRRATGYSHPAVKVFYDKDSGKIVEATYTEYYPPDVKAAAFWLTARTRHRNKTWTMEKDPPIPQLPGQAQAQPDCPPPPTIVIHPIVARAATQMEIEGEYEEAIIE